MSDELSPEVQRLVALTRQARTPSEADKRRVAQRLAVPLAAGAAAGSAAGSAKAGLLSGWGAKLAAVVVASAAASAVVVARLDTDRTTTSPAQPSAQVLPPAAPVRTPVVSEPMTAAPPLAPRAPAPAKPGSAPAAPARSANELAAEAALLHEAQAAWRSGDSARALSLANEHARRFPRSQLQSERDVLRVLSLCKLGQVHAAKQAGARLLRSAQGSPWYQSVAESCAAK